MCKGAAAKVQDQVATAQEETMSSSIAVKSTFIEFSCLGEGAKLGRQVSSPAEAVECAISKSPFPEVAEDASPRDPAGPEPEPECKELDLPWGRLATGERWADQEEEPLEVMEMPTPVQTAWVAPMPQVPGKWAPGGRLALQTFGALALQPEGQPVLLAACTASGDAQESPMPAKTAEKRRRRRGGGSLIDMAKKQKRMAERIVAEAAAGQHGAALHASGVPAASSGAAKNFCSTCQRTAPCAFKFCHFCGKALEPVR